MYVKFKGSESAYACTAPVEQKIIRPGGDAGWAIAFNVYGITDSSELDTIICPETISELTFINNEGKQPTSFVIRGYSSITACIIRHKVQSTVAELQFTKINSPA